MNVQRIKSELRIDHDSDDARLELLTQEALAFVQAFRNDTLLELSEVEQRLVVAYVGWMYDDDLKWAGIVHHYMQLIRTK